MILKMALLADIHVGAISSTQLYEELKTEFLDFIKKRYLDIIFIAGDFYNSVISLNSQSSIMAFKFMNELMDICEANGIKYVRVIEGTLSHDNFQIRNFSMYEELSTVDFRTIETVTVEEICGLKILYIPEEYRENLVSYYAPYFNVPKKHYDLIVGHGMFKETSFIKDDSENDVSKAPILDSKLICSICKGPIFFGHIHTPMIIRKHIYYIGSFSRWVYGQEEDKGFYLCVYDTDTKMYAVEFIVNKLARKFDTIKVDLDKYTKSMDELVKFAKQIRRDNLRIQVIIDGDERDYSYDISFLKEYYSGKTGYKLDIIDKREKLAQMRTEEKVQKILTDYNFLFDNSLPIDTKIRKFIKRKNGKDVSEEMIRSILNINNSEGA